MAAHLHLLICFCFFLLAFQLPNYRYAGEYINKTLIYDAVSRGAVCLDGSPPGYFIASGSGYGSNNWLIFIEGGAWCHSSDNCVARVNSSMNGSTYKRTKHFFSGILDESPVFNPDFYNWNRVQLLYCDGSSFLGDAVDPQTKLYYRGSRVFDAITEDLLSKGMGNADNVILSGSSAGGLATILHCDSFRARLPNAKRVKCISDSGFFLHAKNLPGATSREDYFYQIIKLHGVGKFLPESCTSKNYNLSLCFFPENLIDDIQTPIFLLESSFDLYQLQYQITPYIGGGESEWAECVSHNLSYCNSTQLKIMHEFQHTFIETLQNLNYSSSRGMYVHSCYLHGHLEFNVTWKCSNVVNNLLENKTIAGAIGDWYFDRTPFQHIDLDNKIPRNCTISLNSYEFDWLASHMQTLDIRIIIVFVLLLAYN